MLKKILKITLIVLLLAALAAADVWFVLRNSYPLWVAGVIFAGIIGVFIGILFLRKYFLRRREKKFVERVVQLDESVIKGSPLHERRELRDLQDNWKESISLLKRSTLKKRGNPLYALPWFLVIGESGSGKTTAIRNSRLESPVAYPDKAATISATLNVDWWFFENSIILDTAGRYTIPLDEVPDKEEWERFLALLSKYRRREPVNGVIATISADKLLATDRSLLREDGQNMRKRIDQLMRVVGARFPVYILVTKMDRVYGFNEIFEELGPEDASQAMGYLNTNAKEHWEMFLDEAFESVSDSIGEMALRTVRGRKTLKPGMIVFREEFLRLKPGIIDLMKSVFGDNPYQETPLLRGVFFSSGKQDGPPLSEFLEHAGFAPDTTGKVAVEKGMFLRDIFSRVLPGDRSLYSHTHDFLRWRRITRSLGFTSWLLVCAALIGLLTFSFAHNWHTLKEFTDVFRKLPSLPGDAATNLLTIEKYRLEIEELERNNSRWFFPGFALNQSKVAEQRAKEHFAGFVNKGFLWDFDKGLSANLDKVDPDTDPDAIAVYADYVVTRLGLVSGLVDKGKLPDIKDFGKASAQAIDLYYHTLPFEAGQLFGNIYRDYLRWHPNGAEIQRSRELLEAALITLTIRHKSLEWLVRKSIPDAPDVRLAEFWGTAEVGEHDDAVMVPGCYTKTGQKHISDFLAHIQKNLRVNKAIETLVPPFWSWYQDEYYKAWFDFAGNFHKGADAFQTETARRNVASLMATDHNPYWKLILRLSDETIQSDPKTKPPKWTGLPTELVNIAKLSDAGDDKAKKDKTLKSKITQHVKKVETRTEQELEKADPRTKKIAEQRPSRAKVYTEYLKDVTQLASIASSGDTAFRMVSDLFSGQAALAEDKSPFNMAYTQYLALENMMKEDDYGNTDFIWSLVGGPLNYLIDYGIGKASCSLQDRWEGDVVSKMDGVPREKALKALFDKTDGVVVKYREATAKPFLTEAKLGYTPRVAYQNTIFAHSVPFKPDFLKFLNAVPTAPVEFQSDHPVAIATIPIEVNADATVRPTGNTLSLQCSDGTAILKNYNYPDSRSFLWSPEKCGDTVLKITFPEFTLTKIYKGKTAFATFLTEFSSGAKSFKASDFPANKEGLAKAGIKWIKVRYKIDNAQPVIAGLARSSKKAPSVATECTVK
jgi:type VI secretion system protein ImpL